MKQVSSTAEISLYNIQGSGINLLRLALFILIISVLTSGKLYAQNLENIGSQKPFKISGNINAQLQFYHVNGKQPNRPPFMWYFQGSPMVSIYGISLPFNFVFSEQQRDFRQPFNRFGVSPYYKWIRIYLGYQNLTWSTYSLAGHTITGEGFELTPGKFHIGFMTGRLLKAVETRKVFNGEAINYQTPSFRRHGTSIKVGYGDRKNYADLILLKAKDDPYSLDSIPVTTSITPGENLVLSAVTHQVILKKFLIDAEWAHSIFTPDIRNETASGFNDPVANIFGFLIQPRQGTKSGTAIRAAFGYSSNPFDLKFKYERVAPDFKSMGAYYFLTDLRNITINPTVKLLKRKLVIGGSYGNQIDNLNKDKTARTIRNIGSLIVSFMPVRQYNLNINYSNYGIGQKSGILELDTLTEISQTTSQIAITQALNFQGKSFMHNILASYNYQDLADANQNTAAYSQYRSSILMLNYMVSYMPWALSGGIGFTRTAFNLSNRETLMTGPLFNLNKSLMKNKINVALSLTSYRNTVDNIPSGNITTLSIQASMRPGRHHRFGARFYINYSTSQNINALAYNEKKFDLNYAYTF